MVQIAFVTLFLGLTLGPQPIELTVGGPAVVVELLLDGKPAGRLQGPPWTGQIDFGPRLEPHELVARALDSQGQEIGRAQQWVNLPRSPAEVEVLLERGASAEGGRVTAARIKWQSLTGESPTGYAVEFDGQRLTADTTGRVQLPSYDPETSHVLSVELRFPKALIARKDLAFGGRGSAEISMELTGVPVRLRKGKRLPPADRLQGWFLANGQPLAVAAAEEGPAQLLVVRDSKAGEPLAKLGRPRSRVARTEVERALADPQLARFQMSLGPEDEIRLVWPTATSYGGTPAAGPGARADLFDITREYAARDGGLLWILSRTLPPAEAPSQRLADAVAVAGLRALDGHRRRAVLLVLAGEPADSSQSDPALVRHYLETIRVPLIVWSVVEPGDKLPPGLAAWGEVQDASSLNKLKKAFANLEDDLESQVLIWVDGRHLPQSITLSPAAAEVVELLGR